MKAGVRMCLFSAALGSLLLLASPASARPWRDDLAQTARTLREVGSVHLGTALQRLWTGFRGIWQPTGAEISPGG